MPQFRPSRPGRLLLRNSAIGALAGLALAGALSQLRAQVPAPAVYGTLTPLAALTNSGVAVKASPGLVFMVYCFNPDATHKAYAQLYDALSITGTPVGTFGIAGGTSSGFSGGQKGAIFQTGIEVQAASTATGSGAPTTALDCTIEYN